MVPSVSIEPANRCLQDKNSKQYATGENVADESSVSSRLAAPIRWQQDRFIGAGTSGSVYLGVNLDSESLMAVKEIKLPDTAGIQELRNQIRNERTIMEMLHHPNIVGYYGFEMQEDKVYIFEEYCQGGSLAALLEHGRLEDEGITQVVTMQLLEGLAYLHSQGIVHRDIKPGNILLTESGVIKYADFGSASILAESQEEAVSRCSGECSRIPNMLGGYVNNVLKGTAMYMPPEAIQDHGRSCHSSTDIWSLGCVVLECATGCQPWTGFDNEWAIMFHVGMTTQHPPMPEPGQLSEVGIDLIRQCVTIDSNQRPSASNLLKHKWMEDFAEELRCYEDIQFPESLSVKVALDGPEIDDLAAIEEQIDLSTDLTHLSSANFELVIRLEDTVTIASCL